jgi:S-DNA-T family DNA segregation ATPase FtsK/SpoIIIE
VLLVDDAELLDDQAAVLATLLATPRPDLLVVAAGRNDGLRGQYGSWLRRVRMSRAGLLLQPDADLDGDLLGVRLPRRPLVRFGPGRGYLVEGGAAEVVQVAMPA